MSVSTKKWLNRGGLIAVIVGFVLIKIIGGDTGQVVDTAGTLVTAGGAILVLIREILN